MNILYRLTLLFCLAYAPHALAADTLAIYVNQVAYNSDAPKMAVVRSAAGLEPGTTFMIDDSTGKTVFTGELTAMTIDTGWSVSDHFYRAEFSAMQKTGRFRIKVAEKGRTVYSAPFTVGSQALTKLTLPAILHYYKKQRASSPQEEEADKRVILYGSDKTADVRGGWCDASGDISKYFSHLAYTNTMLPQQIPLVTWSLINTAEQLKPLLGEMQLGSAAEAEALWGADYLMRSLSADGYFYMTVFSYFNKDPHARRVVGLLANSVTTADYQAGFREGGGMAIAALARIARWKKNGVFTSNQYLAAARRAFDHLLINNTRYADNGKENMLDDYCALMASTELWITTGDTSYRKEARKRANNIFGRQAAQGYFMANDEGRPFWHASDAGMPVISLIRYLQKETDPAIRNKTIKTIDGFLQYLLRVTENNANPFGYARQTYTYKGQLREGFFIPHENESGWWWQGENARLASLATAALAGSRLLYKDYDPRRIPFTAFAYRQLGWVLGCNPYNMCFMYGFGQENVPYMASMFGHGSEKGGISNGITGKDGRDDGTGIDFKKEAGGNEWRWTEQWLPHAAWFLQAVTVLAAE